ncbi:Phosphoribosylamine--glycine ligase [Nymphon striatum]|nr:Phosphoribosylamine--glycine ligase [Nymphon striatum]
MTMKVLLIGSGGREHALAWKIAQSERVEKVIVAPGNAGTALENKVENVDINAEDIDGLLDYALQNSIDLTVVGPEAPLVKGVAYGNFTDVDEAIAYIKQQGAPIVVKADGLAAGKGVILAETEEQAIEAVKDMLAGNAFGDAGHRVVIEEFLVGEEASIIVIADDHKARDEGDLGPNTGGMGAYSPAPVVTDEISQKIMKDVIEPTIKGMSDEGHPFTGFLYAGVMIDDQGNSKVLEYNVRFGDPETQPVMMRLKSSMVDLIEAALESNLDKETIEWDQRSSLGVVLAAGGYPDSYNKGDVISGIPEETENSKVFHAGTMDDGELKTNGGRVLCAVGLGDSVSQAKQVAYGVVDKISWNNVYVRRDIGHRAVAREQKLG